MFTTTRKIKCELISTLPKGSDNLKPKAEINSHLIRPLFLLVCKFVRF
jgi:hypothetical protein